MSNEYDYSGLYNNGQGGSTPDPNQGQNNDQPRNEANQTSATRPDQPSQPEQGGYPNVGSSGMNTANTARTDYSAGSSTNNTGANTYNQPNNAYGQNNGYTSSFSGGNGGSNGGYNGYSYASAPQQPPKKEKKHNKVLLRVLAGVGVVALGFGGGIGGAVVASRAGLTGNQVVVQEVQRDTSTDASNTGSTDGTSMTMQQIACCGLPQCGGHHHRADEQQPDLVWRLLCAERCRFRHHRQPGWLHPHLRPCGQRRYQREGPAQRQRPEL